MLLDKRAAAWTLLRVTPVAAVCTLLPVTPPARPAPPPLPQQCGITRVAAQPAADGEALCSKAVTCGGVCYLSAFRPVETTENAYLPEVRRGRQGESCRSCELSRQHVRALVRTPQLSLLSPASMA